MSRLKSKYVKRKDSDQSVTSNIMQRREDLYNVSNMRINIQYSDKILRKFHFYIQQEIKAANK